MDISNILGSVFSGGLTGLLGVVTQKVFEYKSKQLDAEMQKDKFANDVAMKEADAKIMAQEWAARTTVAQTEEKGVEAKADAQAFSAALTNEPSRYSDGTKLNQAQEWLMVILDTIRGLVRPMLTLYLCGITTVIYWQAKQLLGSQAISVDQAINMVRTIVETVLYLTTSCVLFWFGSRVKSRPPKI